MNLSRIKGILTTAALSFALISMANLTSKALGSDHWQPLDEFKLKEILARIEITPNFKIEVNDLVLKELNQFLSTSKSREFLSNSLSRLNFYLPMVQKKLAEYDLPVELAAVPIVESGYQNLPDRNSSGYGAGIWMFIKPTARIYGLRVDDTIDERLNENLLTDAAARYFHGAKQQFGTWGHAILAFNLGNGAVKDAIAKLNSVDPWAIVRSGRENDRGYLAKVYAAMIIVKNPDLLNHP